MMWYSAKLLYRTSIEGSESAGSLSEESIRVIVADSEEEAWRKAMLLGHQEEHKYLNDKGESVAWRFVDVVEVQDLCEEEIVDGTEVFSEIF